jgi:hypothetical protein
MSTKNKNVDEIFMLTKIFLYANIRQSNYPFHSDRNSQGKDLTNFHLTDFSFNFSIFTELFYLFYYSVIFNLKTKLCFKIIILTYEILKHHIMSKQTSETT